MDEVIITKFKKRRTYNEKTLKLLTILTLCLTLFTGCCLSHDWTEADCVTPKTCAKCGETEGEALGHSFADATCLSPKTCTGCGLTEGKSLEHNLGTWEETSDGATRKCSGCDLIETVSAEEWIVHQFFIGSWTAYRIDQSSGYRADLTDEHSQEFQCVFHEDGSCEMILQGIPYRGNWRSISEFEEMAKNRIEVITTDNNHFAFFSAESIGYESDMYWWLPSDHGSFYTSFRRSELDLELDVSSVSSEVLTAENLVGTWKATDSNVFFYTFSSDGTYTFNAIGDEDSVELESGTYEILGNTVSLYQNGNKTTWTEYILKDGKLVSDSAVFEKQ